MDDKFKHTFSVIRKISQVLFSACFSSLLLLLIANYSVNRNNNATNVWVHLVINTVWTAAGEGCASMRSVRFRVWNSSKSLGNYTFVVRGDGSLAPWSTLGTVIHNVVVELFIVMDWLVPGTAAGMALVHRVNWVDIFLARSALRGHLSENNLGTNTTRE